MDGIISMALSNEEENFVKISKIHFNVVQPYLRKLFITKWEEKYPNEIWQSNNKSGNALVAKIAKVNKKYADKLKAGDEQQWETAILVYVFLYSGLNLIDQCRNPKETRVPPLRISEEIDIIMETRNVFSHAKTMSCTSHDFSVMVGKLKSAARNIFGANAEKEIDDIVKVQFETPSTANLMQRLEDEKNRIDQLNQPLEEPYKKKGSDDMIKLDLSTDKSNFVKVKKVLLNVLPKYLRQLFKDQWNRKYPNQEWDSSRASGSLLLKKLSDRVNSDADFEMKLTTGNEQKWDATTLIFILLDSGLNLSTNGDMREDIKMLKAIDSSFFADKSKASMSSEDFIEKMDKIKSIAGRIFNENAEKEVNDIENSPEERKMKIKLRQLLAKEKSRKRDTDQSEKILEKGYKAQTEFRPEEANFRTIEDLLFSVILNHLRKFFKCRWDQQYPNREWKSNSGSGEFLFSELSDQFKTTIADMEINKLKTGNETDWGYATIANILLDSHLQLATEFEPKEGIETLIEIEKSFYEDKDKMECSFDDFKYFAGEIILASKKVLNDSANDEVNGILRLHEEKLKAVQFEKKLEDPVEYFELAVQEVYFVKIIKILFDVLPKYLRKCFIEHWNRKYSADQWKSDDASGQLLIRELSEGAKKRAKQLNFMDKLQKGNEEKWDASVLAFVMHSPDLKLILESRDKKNRVPPLRISEEISIIKDTRNDFSHAENMICSSNEFKNTIAKLKSAVKNIFSKDAENAEKAEKEIDNIAKSQTRMQMSDANKEQLKEAIIQVKLEEKLKDASTQPTIDVKGCPVVIGDNTIVNVNIAESHKATERSIDEVRDSLKSTYKGHYQTHRIHAIDEMKKIILKEVKITEFAVTLKLSHTLPPACTYKDETRQLLENLIGATSKNIDLSDLFDEYNRVTFVRGIAGIGKSVLAKQLACEWANDVMYKDFKLLIMFECRKLNNFISEERADLRKHELIDEFLKKKLDCTYEDGEKILFVIDGLDELYDIDTDNSIIWGLLDNSNARHSQCKFILTGRPCVECYLDRYDKNVGVMQKVEIQGLSDEQIKEYVDKIASTEKDHSSIDQAMKSSKKNLPILYVPQFLNTFCCVAILTEGQKVQCKAELYTWTLHLLLKQHADNDKAFKNPAEKVFSKFSKHLIALGKICNELLLANKIIFEEDITSRFDSSGTVENFFQSLFVDVSDEISTKYQFKHLSLVEFLSALHICCSNDPKELIKDILKKNYIETVIHACELIANSAREGIVKTLLSKTANLQNIDPPNILTDTLKVISDIQVNADHEAKFSRSLEVLACFLTKGATRKKPLLSSLKELSCGPLFKSVIKDSNTLHDISEYLEAEHNCSEKVLKTAFKGIEIGEFVVGKIETVGCVQYMGIVDLVDFNGMKIAVNDVRREVERIGDGICSLVWIEDCEAIENEESKHQSMMKNSKVDELVIWNCKLNEYNFRSSIEWGASSGKLILDQLKVEAEWWQIMVEIIEREKKKFEGVKMRELIMNSCEPKIPDRLQQRIVQCKVNLIIDSNIYPSSIVPPSEQGLQSASSSTNENTKPSKGSQSCHCLLS